MLEAIEGKLDPSARELVAHQLGVEPEHVTAGFVHEMRIRIHDYLLFFHETGNDDEWAARCHGWALEVIALLEKQ